MPYWRAGVSKKKTIFNKHAMFIILHKLTYTTKSKDVLRQRLIQRQNFWIQTMQTLHPKGLN